MMTGSIDTEKVNDALPFVGQVGFLNFLIFIILMVVLIFAIYNQLTGVAIAKVSVSSLFTKQNITVYNINNIEI